MWIFTLLLCGLANIHHYSPPPQGIIILFFCFFSYFNNFIYTTYATCKSHITYIAYDLQYIYCLLIAAGALSQISKLHKNEVLSLPLNMYLK